MKNKLKQISKGQNILLSGFQLVVIALLVFILLFLLDQLDGAEPAVVTVSLVLAYAILQYVHISNRRKKDRMLVQVSLKMWPYLDGRADDVQLVTQINAPALDDLVECRYRSGS